MPSKVWVVVAGVLIHAGCGDGSSSPESAALPAPPAPSARAIGVEGRANANVSMTASGRFVAMAWSAAEPGGATDIYSAISRDGGQTFADPVRVNSDPGTARVSGEQPPRLALDTTGDGDPVVSVIWTAQGTRGTTLMASRSPDGGRSFEAATLIPGTDAPGNRGWESLAAFADGRVASVWLDHRQLADAAEAAAHHEHGAGSDADGVAMAERSQLYFAMVGGGEPRPLTGGVCYCCKTAMATGMFGLPETVAIAWRHVYPGNLRDIAFTLSADGGRTFNAPARVSEDQWSIAGCPDDGPAMAVDAAGRVHLVWPTAVTDDGQLAKALFHAVTSDGVTFSPRVRLPTEGQANHPQIAAAPDGTLTVMWDESGSGTRHIAMAVGRPDRDGSITFARQPMGEATGVYPVLAAAGSAMLGAWTSGPADRSTVRVVALEYLPH